MTGFCMRITARLQVVKRNKNWGIPTCLPNLAMRSLKSPERQRQSNMLWCYITSNFRKSYSVFWDTAQGNSFDLCAKTTYEIFTLPEKQVGAENRTTGPHLFWELLRTPKLRRTLIALISYAVQCTTFRRIPYPDWRETLDTWWPARLLDVTRSPDPCPQGQTLILIPWTVFCSLSSCFVQISHLPRSLSNPSPTGHNPYP